MRDHVGVMDHGGFSKYEVAGPGATAFLDRVFCSALPKPGRVKLAYMLTPKGRIWSEATIARLDENHYLLCGPTLAARRDFDWLRCHLPADGSVRLGKGSARDAALMVMGPKSRALLARLTTADLSATAMPWMALADIEVAGRPVTALRVSYVGELGWELHMTAADLPAIYRALCGAGQEFGLTDFGSYALNAMRLEKGYHAWGADFGTEYSVFDAGLERFVSFDKAGFVGREAVLRQRGQSPEWCFAGFIVEGAEGDALPGDPIHVAGEPAGYVTSGGTGFRLGKRLALGYVRRDSAPAGETGYEIECLGRRCLAVRSATPFYDPENLRPRR